MVKAKKSISIQVNTNLEALRAKVLRRREYLDLLETELTNTRAIIHEFTQLYNARIAPLEKEQKRLSRLLERWSADLAPPPSGWHGRGKRAPQQADSNGHVEQEPIRPKKRPQSADPDYERKVRDLFRRLAKRYHPDLAQEEEDKKHFEMIMAEINQAYMAKDLKALESLAQAHSASLNGGSRLPAAEMARLTLELRQLDAMIFEIEQTIRELDLSPAMQMRGDANEERPHRRDILREMESDYRERISDLREQLIALGVEIDETKAKK
ncbi:MAG: hypothetical protein M1347_06980 [Chloroflexi bacterium]|nr:hypothetical protein [Chloroflexota bacterium]